MTPTNGSPSSLHGTTLHEALTTTPLRRDDALDVLVQIAAALAALHAAGRAHGAVDPAHVDVLPVDAAVSVNDAPVPVAGGLRATLRTTDDGAPPAARVLARAAQDPRALEDVVYVAPELLAGGAPTDAGDVYALAALAARLLGGAPATGFLRVGLFAKDPQLTQALVAALEPVAADRVAAAALGTAFIAARDAARASASSTSADPRGVERPRRGVDADPDHVDARPFAQQPYRPSAARESEMSGLLTAVLVVGGFFVFIGALWLGFKGWDELSDPGRLTALALLTTGVLAGGLFARRGGWKRTGDTLVVLATQLLWADAAYAIDIYDLDGEEPWVVASGFIAGVTFVAAGGLGLAFLAALSALDAVIFAAFVGAALRTGTVMGPSYFLLLVAAGFAVVAAVGHRWRGAKLGAPHAVCAVGALGISGLLAFEYIDDPAPALRAVLWPYAMGAIGALSWWRAPSPYRGVALFVVVPWLFTPTFEAWAQAGSVPFEAIAVAIGAALLVLAFAVLTDDDARDRQAAAVMVGTVHVLGSPLTEAWRLCVNRPLDETNLVAFCVAVGLAAGLVAVGVGASSRATRTASYWIAEASGALALLGLVMLLSWVRLHDDVYVAILFGAAVVLLLLGVFLERLSLSVIAAAFLLLNVWVQYFARLSELLPMSILLIGFGIGLLVLGFLYEKGVKRMIPSMKDWA